MISIQNLSNGQIQRLQLCRLSLHKFAKKARRTRFFFDYYEIKRPDQFVSNSALLLKILRLFLFRKAVKYALRSCWSNFDSKFTHKSANLYKKTKGKNAIHFFKIKYSHVLSFFCIFIRFKTSPFSSFR